VHSAKYPISQKFIMKVCLAFIVLLVSFYALAEVRPNDIKQALMKENVVGARALVDQALQEHPKSSEVHLWNAYVLIKEKKLLEADKELYLVTNGTNQKVKDSELYGIVVTLAHSAKQNQQLMVQAPHPTKTQATAHHVQAVPETNHESSGFSFGLFILIVGVCIVGIFLWNFFTRKNTRDTYTPSYSSYTPAQDYSPVRAHTALSTSTGPTTPVVYQTPVTPYQPSGSYSGGQVLGAAAVGAGLGYLAGRAHSTTEDDTSSSRQETTTFNRSFSANTDPDPIASVQTSAGFRDDDSNTGNSFTDDMGSSSDSSSFSDDN
jgi:hypothetical protein